MLRPIRAIILFLFILCLSGTLMGDDSAENYFPTAVDSFWVYEDQDGNELTRRAVDGEEIAGEKYHAFDYEPSFENWQDYSCFLHASLYKVNDDGIALVVGDEIEKALKARLKYEADPFLEAMMKEPQGRSVDIDIIADAQNDFLLLPDTVVENEEWDVTEKKGVIKMKVNEPGMPESVIMSFIFDISETGIVHGSETVIVPAGTFEDCLKIEYRTETTLSFFPIEFEPDDDEIEPAGETVTTVWYAPNVGIVKYHQEKQHIFLEAIPEDTGIPKPENPEPITFELKEYEIKTDGPDSEKSE